MSHVLFSFLFCLWCGRQRERLSKAARVWKTNAKFSTQRCFSKMDQLKLSHLVLLRCEICIQEFRSAVPPFLLCTAILHTLFKLTVLRHLNGTCSRGYCMDGKRMLCNYSSKRKGYGTVLLRGWPKMPLLYVVRFLRENIHYTTVEGCVGSDWIYWLFIYFCFPIARICSAWRKEVYDDPLSTYQFRHWVVSWAFLFPYFLPKKMKETVRLCKSRPFLFKGGVVFTTRRWIAHPPFVILV